MRLAPPFAMDAASSLASFAVLRRLRQTSAAARDFAMLMAKLESVECKLDSLLELQGPTEAAMMKISRPPGFGSEGKPKLVEQQEPPEVVKKTLAEVIMQAPTAVALGAEKEVVQGDGPGADKDERIRREVEAPEESIQAKRRCMAASPVGDAGPGDVDMRQEEIVHFVTKVEKTTVDKTDDVGKQCATVSSVAADKAIANLAAAVKVELARLAEARCVAVAQAKWEEGDNVSRDVVNLIRFAERTSTAIEVAREEARGVAADGASSAADVAAANEKFVHLDNSITAIVEYSAAEKTAAENCAKSKAEAVKATKAAKLAAAIKHVKEKASENDLRTSEWDWRGWEVWPHGERWAVAGTRKAGQSSRVCDGYKY